MNNLMFVTPAAGGPPDMRPFFVFCLTCINAYPSNRFEREKQHFCV
jgi:hypothetical protein